MFEITYLFINSNVRFSSGVEEIVSSIKHWIKQLSCYYGPPVPKFGLKLSPRCKAEAEKPIDSVLPSHANLGPLSPNGWK